MKKMLIAILVCITNIGNKTTCMENQLFSMIKEDNPDGLEKIISRNPHMLNAYNAEKTTILHNAVQWGKVQCIKKLLMLKANPNNVDSAGNSPLHKAIECKAPPLLLKIY